MALASLRGAERRSNPDTLKAGWIASSHTVITSEQYFWLIVLLGVIILIGLIVWGTD